MPDAITIRIALDAGDINATGQKIARGLQSALDSAFGNAAGAGRKVGDALGSGLQATAQKIEGQIKAIRERAEQTRINDQQKANQRIEQDALKHAARLEAIATQGAAKLAQQEAKRLADLDILRERFAQKEIERQRKLDQQAQRNSGALAFIRRFSSTVREAGESIQQAGEATTRLLTQPLLDLGRAAVKSAIDIDRQVNVLKALTGSAEAAEARFKSLVALSAKSPGLTTSLATTLDAQLRVAGASVAAIDKLLPVVGKLNAISPLGDPQKFTQNLVQLITQNFERQDLKELIGQSPLAGELVKTLFKVDSPTNAKAIRESAAKLGITTVDALANGLATAAASNSKLANVTESLGTRLEKLRDRVEVAFRPLGLAIVNALAPIVERAVPIIERISKAFDELSPGAKQAILIFAGLAAAIGPLVIALGAVIQALGAVGNVITVVSAALGVGGAAAGGGVVASLSAVLPILAALAAAVVLLFAAWQTNFGGIRDITADVVKEVIGLFQELRDFWKEIAPDLAVIGKVGLEALSAVFSAWSGTVGAVWSNTWDLIKSVVRESLDVIKPFISSVLALLQGDFAKFSADARKVWGEVWDFIVFIPAKAFATLIKIVEDGITSLLTTSGFAKGVGLQIGESLGQGVIDGFLQVATSPTTAAAIRGALLAIRGDSSGRDAARNAARAASAGRGNDGEEITSTQLAQNQAFLNPPKTPPVKPPPGTDGKGAESKARQLRESQLKSQLEFLKDAERLQKDSNDRQIRLLEEQFSDFKDVTSEGYTVLAQQTRGFYEETLRLKQLNINNQIGLIDSEITAERKTLAASKANTPERIRLGEQINKLLTDREILFRSLTDAEQENSRKFGKSLDDQREKLLKITQSLALTPVEGQLPTDLIAGNVDPRTQAARDQIATAQQATIDFRLKDLELQRQEVAIQNAVTTGQLNEAQAKEATLALQRQYGAELIRQLELQKAGLDPEQLARINVQIEQLRGLGAELTPLQSLFKGLRSQSETLADSFEKIGSAFKDKVLGVVDSGIDKLTSKLGFFKSLVGDILKSLTRVLLGGLLQPRGGAQAGGGSFISNILGSVLGGNAAGGGSGLGSFATGGFAGGGGAASILGGGSGGGGILGALTQAIGGGISAPRSITLGGLPIAPNIPIPGAAQIGGGGATGGLGSLLGGGLGSLFKGIGFGKAPGSGGALAGALPLLGLSLGSSLGTDRLTSILGGVAGGLLGVGLTAAPAIIGAGGALSGLGFLAPLFSNPFTAIAAGLALPAIFLLGRARQRRRDESTSGDYLQQAVDGIKDLRKQVERNEITLNVSQARDLFNTQILQPFIDQIKTIKTKSVRESRLKNQTVDLRNLFEKEVIPAVQAQKTRQGINDKLVPEFAVGGYHRGVGLALLHDREAILNLSQQSKLQAIAGQNILQQIGVPDATPAPVDAAPAFARGGIFTAPTRSNATPTINMTVQLVVSPDDATGILNAAASTDDGQVILVNAQKVAQRNGIGRTRI